MPWWLRVWGEGDRVLGRAALDAAADEQRFVAGRASRQRCVGARCQTAAADKKGRRLGPTTLHVRKERITVHMASRRVGALPCVPILRREGP